MHTKSIGLIIIDSVAGVFRLEDNAINRANNMRKLVIKLQTLADEYECAVVCVNQVELLFFFLVFYFVSEFCKDFFVFR